MDTRPLAGCRMLWMMPGGATLMGLVELLERP